MRIKVVGGSEGGRWWWGWIFGLGLLCERVEGCGFVELDLREVW